MKPAPAPGLGPATLALSLALHLLGIGIVYGVPRLLPRHSDGVPVYVVDLMSLPPAPAALRSSDAGRPSRKTPVRKPPPKPKPAEKAIKIPERGAPRPEPQKPPPRPPPEPPKIEPQDEPAPTSPPDPQPDATPATAEPDPVGDAPPGGSLPGAVPGPSSGVGIRMGDGGPGDEFTFYLSLLDRNIRRSWREPLYTGSVLLSATVGLEVSSTGRVMRLDLTAPSGYGPLDRSVIRAVRDAEPFPPFPHFLRRDSLAVQIIFDLEPQGPAAKPHGD